MHFTRGWLEPYLYLTLTVAILLLRRRKKNKGSGRQRASGLREIYGGAAPPGAGVSPDCRDSRQARLRAPHKRQGLANTAFITLALLISPLYT